MMSTEADLGSVQVKTLFDEDFEVNIQHTRWSWHSRQLTSDCWGCQLFVPLEEAAKIAAWLIRRNPNWEDDIPPDQVGLCGYGFSSGHDMPLFIEPNRRSSIRACKNSETERKDRAEEKRKTGTLS